MAYKQLNISDMKQDANHENVLFNFTLEFHHEHLNVLYIEMLMMDYCMLSKVCMCSICHSYL